MTAPVRLQRSGIIERSLEQLSLGVPDAKQIVSLLVLEVIFLRRELAVARERELRQSAPAPKRARSRRKP